MAVTIPIGPQHPALKEPIHLTVTVDGETIVDRCTSGIQPPRN